MKKRISAGIQVLQLAEKKFELEQKMADRLETMSSDHKEAMKKLPQTMQT